MVEVVSFYKELSCCFEESIAAVLVVVEYALDGAVVVVGREGGEADVLERDGLAEVTRPRREVLNGQL